MAIKKRPASRYSMARACANIELAMSRSNPPLLDKEVADAIGMAKDLWSRKMSRSRSSFSLEELGQVADFFHAPPGWPVLDADVTLKR
jgi:hypothetical protein